MKEPHIEGVATHDDPESCAAAREGGRRSVDRGTHGLGIEPRKQAVRGADAVILMRKATRPEGDIASPRAVPARSKTRSTCGTFSRENREIPRPPAADGAAGRAGKADGRTPAMHGAGEVGQARSTDEAAEQRRATGRGGGGGKGPGQGKRGRAKRAPDTEPDQRAKCARPCT